MARRQTKRLRFSDPAHFKRMPIGKLPAMKCRYCPSVADTWDHAIPKCRGGLNTPDNKFPTCNVCNNDKRHMTHEEYILYLDRGRDESIRLVSEIRLLTLRASQSDDPIIRLKILRNKMTLCAKATKLGVPQRVLADACNLSNHRSKYSRYMRRYSGLNTHLTQGV